MLNKINNYVLLKPTKIKLQNEGFLLNKGARVCEWLPHIEHRNKIRSSTEIASRAAILFGIFHIFLGMPSKKIRQWLDANNLFPYLSEEESELLQTHEKDISEKEMCDISWYIEYLYAFLWVGSLVENLYEESFSHDEVYGLYPNIDQNVSLDEFFKKFRIRSYSQIYRVLDYYYRAHWFVRDARLCGEDIKGFNYDIVQSRRKVLEWIFDPESDWDDVDLST